VLGQAEVREVDVLLSLVVRDEDVRGLHVSVDQATAVCRVQGRSDRTEECDRPVGVDRALPREQGPKVRAADVAHRDEELPLGLARLVHRHDVGVLQTRGELGLPHEARAERIVRGELGGKDLDRNAPAETSVLGKVDNAHPAAPEQGLDPVEAEGGARPEVCAHRGFVTDRGPVRGVPAGFNEAPGDPETR
jgi:hypothetical protein